MKVPKAPKPKTIKAPKLRADGTEQPTKPKTTDMLGSFAKIDSQAQSISRQWQINHPDFISTAVDYAVFKQEADDYSVLLAVDSEHDEKIIQNTRIMNGIKQKIKEGVTVFRSYLKTELFINKEIDINMVLFDCAFSYRVTKTGRTNFFFPSSVENQLEAIKKIIIHLQTPNNPYANKEMGLNYWQQIQTAYASGVRESETLRAKKSELSRSKNFQAVKLKTLLLGLKSTIKGTYYNSRAEQVLRTFGFLKENF